MTSPIPVRVARSVAFAAIFLGGIGFANALFAAQPAPWSERAEESVRQFVTANAQQLANHILRIAHPEGRRAELAGMEVLASADHAVVYISVGWSGTSASRRHLIRVTWEFTPTRHLSARITGESLPANVAARRKAQLDEHFREEIYPAIARNASAAKP